MGKGLGTGQFYAAIDTPQPKLSTLSLASMSTTDTPFVAPRLTSGLGNRLFQYAAAAGAAERWGRPVVFLSTECGVNSHNPTEHTLFRMFPRIPLFAYTSPDPLTVLAEPRNRFLQHVYLGDSAPTPGPILIHGYRQNPGYFPKAAEVLKPDWDAAIGAAGLQRIAQEAELTDASERRRTVALHMRLGDYLSLPHHQLDLGHYYNQALNRVPAGSRVHLFSDQPELCRGMFERAARARSLDFTVAAVRKDVESLYEFTLCLGGTIVANSTFSWWGAWFAHAQGAAWAVYPSRLGQGLPDPVDYWPVWGEVLPVSEGEDPPQREESVGR